MADTAFRHLRSFAACLALLACAPGFADTAVWKPDVLVPGSPFRGLHGLAFGPDGMIYAGSVMGQAIHRVDPATGASSVTVAPPHGEADDVEFGPDGTMYWTGFIQGTMNARTPDGSLHVIARGLPGLNSLALDARGRLFGSQVFMDDALWEFDTTGKREPRLVMRDLGGLNGFDFGADGRLCGPLWFRGQIVCIDVDSGRTEVVAEGLKQPAAANFDSQGRLFAIDNETGEIFRIDIAARRRELVATAPSNLDNLAFSADDRLFVTNMADNAIYEVNLADGSVRTVVASALTLPGGIAVDGRTLYVADTFSIAAVELPAGHVRDVSRTLNDSAYPQLAATAPGRLATASTQTGFLQLRDTATGAVIGRWSGLAQPLALAMPDAGRIAVAEAAAGGRLLLLDAQDSTARRLIASGFDTPGGLVATADGYVLTGQGVGEVILLGHDGTRRTLTSGLARPQGIAALSDGSLVLVETGARRLLRLDPHSGEISVVAQDLPLGIAGREGQAPEAAPIGVAVDAGDTIYLGLDRDGSILRLRRH